MAKKNGGMPTDKAVHGTVSELPGCNESERTGSLEKSSSKGRDLVCGTKAAALVSKLANAASDLGGVIAIAR